ncbi:hypothetical protein V6N13_088921 [Hibiscus sabdariffa]
MTEFLSLPLPQWVTVNLWDNVMAELWAILLRLANEVELGQARNTLITAIHDLVMKDWEVLIKYVGRIANGVADSPIVMLRGHDPG